MGIFRLQKFIKKLCLPQRIFAGFWFAVAGLLANVIGISISALLLIGHLNDEAWQLIRLIQPTAVVVGGALGVLYGYVIISWPIYQRNYWNAARLGFWGGIIAFICVALAIDLLPRYQTLVAGNISWRLEIKTFLLLADQGFMLGGWASLLVGILASCGLHAFNTWLVDRRKPYHD